MARTAVGVGCLAVVLLALFPPVRNLLDATRREREYLISQFVTAGDPVAPREVDGGRLLAECLLVVGAVGGVCAASWPKPQPAEPGPASPGRPS